MEIIRTENLSFKYPGADKNALDNISLTVNRGDYICICGKSGCGKTTLLKFLKPTLTPYGQKEGKIFYLSKDISALSERDEASQIGFVMQNINEQIVTDKVWHELAFGLESLGVPTPEIRRRVAEMASFFGIDDWFHKKTSELSGGQKQILNLASVMLMQPSVLILDEPTSQLDPIAAADFLNLIKKINCELATTIIISEHRLDEVFPAADKVIVIDSGKIIANDSPVAVCKKLRDIKHDMYAAMPAVMRVFENDCALTVRDGRIMLDKVAKSAKTYPELIPDPNTGEAGECLIELKDVRFRYERELSDVIKGLNFKVNKNEIHSIFGGNATGKTTMLALISGLYKPYCGEVLISGHSVDEIEHLYDGVLGIIPQNPQDLFVKKTVLLDLMDMTDDEDRLKTTAEMCGISHLFDRHPSDLSGGEAQCVAVCKILLKCPQILLLDEPTKGLDAHFKNTFRKLLLTLKASGVTIIMVSHDIEFCAKVSDRCSMFFDGEIISTAPTRRFFISNSFYTTSANKMARGVFDTAVTDDDIVLALTGKKAQEETYVTQTTDNFEIKLKNNNRKRSLKRILFGSAFVALLIAVCVLRILKVEWLSANLADVIAAGAFIGIITSFFPQKDIPLSANKKTKLTKRSLLSALLVVITIPLTILLGIYHLDDRKYYIISMLIILQTLLAFATVFENRKPKARELITISVMCAIAVAGRTVFFMLAQFKPVAAIVIISGICFGAETGFLVGAITAFVSNFFFGQGPWTPWQMFALGIIGFIAGILFNKGAIKANRMTLAVFGFISVVAVYGIIMNVASVIMMQPYPTFEMVIASCGIGLPFDLIHGCATAFFLWFLTNPLTEKIQRIKEKYGI